MQQKTRRYSRSLILAHLVRKTSAWTVVLVLLAGIPAVWAQGNQGPNKNIEAIGVPPIPASLAREVQPYNGIYGLPLAGWDPAKREIWLKGLSSVTWISRVRLPEPRPRLLRSTFNQAASMTFTSNRKVSIWLTQEMQTATSRFNSTFMRSVRVIQRCFRMESRETRNRCGPTLETK